jgi:transcriptional regulator with XRE-family HTH domain
MTNQPAPLVRTADDLAPGHWMARQLPAGASLRGYAEDRAISVVTAAVQRAIDNAGLSRADVARALGTTKSHVSQVLNGSTNMTLKTLGALLWACGRQVAELRSTRMGSAAYPATRAIVITATIRSSAERETAYTMGRDEVASYHYGPITSGPLYAHTQ